MTHLMEGIGIALDVPGRPHVRDRLRRLDLLRDGSMESGERNFLYAQGNLTGIAYAEIPEGEMNVDRTNPFAASPSSAPA